MEGEFLPAERTTVERGRRPDLVRELAVVAVGVGVYFGGRELVQGSRSAAVRDAEWIIRFERWLGVDVERDIQDVAQRSDLFRDIGNYSYVWLHWPLLIVILAVLFVRNRVQYRRLRDAMFASGAIAIGIFAMFPAAPPRFMPGFVGTVSDDARRHYLAIPLSWSNPFASFPSFHVGWTLIACLALAATLHRRRAVLFAMVPAVLVGVSVVSTGNHYVVDAVAGAVIALTAFWWSGRRRRRSPGQPSTSYEYDTSSSPAQSSPVSVTSR